MVRNAALLALFAVSANRALAANPIRKVVTMLQELQEKVVEEGKQEQKLFDQFMCYCKTSSGTLSAGMEEAKAKIESLEAALKGAGEKKAQTEQDLKDHQQAKADAKEAIASATALREKQAAEYAKLAADNKANIDAMNKAVNALSKGSSGSFLQTTAAMSIRRFAMEKAELADGDRDTVLAFLSGTQADGYAPQAGAITGILKAMLDTLVKNDADAKAAEEAAIAVFQELVSAKKAELETLQTQIEDEQLRIGELGVLLATGANDIKATQRSLEADQQFALELQTSCSTKEAEWDEIVKTRNEELLALAEVVKVLNDDDALDAFSKALPAASFIQVSASSEARSKALAAVRAAASASVAARPQLDLIELALSGKKVGFDKVLKLIDDLVSNLHKEQEVDNEKKSYCAQKFDEAEDKQKELERAIHDSEAAIDELEGSIEKLHEEVKALTEGIKELDKSVAEATARREQEHADYSENIAANKAAKDLLLWAKNRLNKFYNPKLYKPEAAAAFFQVAKVSSRRLFHGEKPPPPPEAPGAYSKKSEESAGVIAAIDGLVADLDKETQEAEIEEKNAQKSYEKVTADAAAKRTADSAAITEKEAAIAAQEGALQAETDRKKGSESELAATLEVLNGLHNECDWLLQHFDVRKEARTAEIEGLEKAKAVLHGADYSLAQTGAVRKVSKRAGFLAA